MAIRFIDGFAHYTNGLGGTNPNQIYAKWTQVGGGPKTGTAGPGGTPSLEIDPSQLIGTTIDYQGSWIFSFRFMVTNTINSAVIMQFNNVATTLGLVRIETDATISAYAGNQAGNPSFLIGNSGSNGFSIVANTWYRIECKISWGSTTPIQCTAEVKVNGTVWVTQGTKNTNFNITDLLIQNGSSPETNNIQINAFNSGQLFIQDLYLLDTQGTANNDYQGDGKVRQVFPDGDVDTQWNNSSGGTSFSLINEHPPDGDASYVYSSTVGDRDNFTWQDISSFAGRIIGIQYSVYARKDDEGLRTIKLTVGSGGSEAQTDELYLNDSYIYYRYPLDVDPATSTAWTVSGFNAKTFGFLIGTTTNT